MIPASSPVNRVLATTQKAVEHDRQLIKRHAPARVKSALAALDTIADLAYYNPTKQQCDTILAALRDGIANIEKRFSEIEPKQVTFNLE